MKQKSKYGKGDRTAQRRRRKARARLAPQVMAQKESYEMIDGNMTRHPVAFCTHYQGYLTMNMINTHRCTKRHCNRCKALQYDIKGKMVGIQFNKIFRSEKENSVDNGECRV